MYYGLDLYFLVNNIHLISKSYFLTDSMVEKKYNVAVFDFDGTLTTKDTLLEFIKFSCGIKRFCIGFALLSPFLLLMKMRLYPNGKAKEKILSFFFKGWDYERFSLIGHRFSKNIDSFVRKKIVSCLHDHLMRGDIVYVVTASIEEWVRPWCIQHGVNYVLATKMEIQNRKLTGRLSTPNCYGQEKVNRFLKMESNRTDYYLIVYGDSKGDIEMMDLADEKIYLK